MLDHLEDNIRRVIADIRPQMLEKVIENWTSRLDYIRASRGSSSGSVSPFHTTSPRFYPRDGHGRLSFSSLQWVDKYQACLGSKYWGFEPNCPPERSFCACTSVPKATNTDMDTVSTALALMGFCGI
ncbi:hypothetical protein TNCV_75621 [Trichonephila clavipes]|nr:hypothetical protein TNCV_75621 [Trichonephila clavipes]